MSAPENQSRVGLDSGDFQFSEAHDSTEVISRPFPFDFLVLIGLILLSPLLLPALQGSVHRRVFELQALVIWIPYFTAVLFLSLSVVRNQQRSPIVRTISTVVAIPVAVFLFRWICLFV